MMRKQNECLLQQQESLVQEEPHIQYEMWDKNAQLYYSTLKMKMALYKIERKWPTSEKWEKSNQNMYNCVLPSPLIFTTRWEKGIIRKEKNTRSGYGGWKFYIADRVHEERWITWLGLFPSLSRSHFLCFVWIEKHKLWWTFGEHPAISLVIEVKIVMRVYKLNSDWERFWEVNFGVLSLFFLWFWFSLLLLPSW